VKDICSPCANLDKEIETRQQQGQQQRHAASDKKGGFLWSGCRMGSGWWGGYITPTLPLLHPPSEHATWVACWIL